MWSPFIHSLCQPLDVWGMGWQQAVRLERAVFWAAKEARYPPNTILGQSAREWVSKLFAAMDAALCPSPQRLCTICVVLGLRVKLHPDLVRIILLHLNSA